MTIKKMACAALFLLLLVRVAPPQQFGGAHAEAAVRLPLADPTPTPAPSPVPPAVPTVRLPTLPVPPVPVPPPPTSPAALAPDQLYVIDADVACTVLASPTGLLKLTSDAGPMRIRGKFVDGTAVETRLYKGKFIYIVESMGTAGKVELIIVPSGAASEADILRRCLVLTGIAPPVPPLPPGPTPVPPTPGDPLTAAFQAGYTACTDSDRAKSLAYLQTVYAGLAAAAASTTPPSVITALKTNADALALLKAAVGAPGIGLTATQVVPLRTAISAELAASLGTATTTALDLKKFAAELTRIATALEGVK